MTGWEYTRAEAHLSGPLEDSSEVLRKASEAWLGRLNSLGAEDWELVSEEKATGSVASRDYHARFAGTLKRPRG